MPGPYFNGQTSTTPGIEIEKFVQKINLDINRGIKETFYIFDNSNSGNELGISQTIHVGPSIVMGTEEIQISDFDGMEFDRDYIIENKANILELTDSINYDFDTGIESLTKVNIIHDSFFFDNTYKINLDYSNGRMGTEETIPFIGYLEIDPTFTTSATSNSWAGSASFDVSSLPSPIIVSSATAGHETLTSSQISSLESSSGSGSYSHTWASNPQYTMSDYRTDNQDQYQNRL